MFSHLYTIIKQVPSGNLVSLGTTTKAQQYAKWLALGYFYCLLNFESELTCNHRMARPQAAKL